MGKLPPLLLLLIPLTPIGLSASKESDLGRSYGSIVSDPSLFHYDKMRHALSHGNVKLASRHAHVRTQFLTLTYRPFSDRQIARQLKLPGASSTRLAQSPEPVQLDDKLTKAKKEAAKIKLPLKDDFSKEIGKMLRENEENFESLTTPPE